MKVFRFLLPAVLAFMTTSLFAQQKTDTFKVYGNCGMCKSRIEKASNADGVISASWNTETKMMTLVYDAAKVTAEKVQQKIAAVGHDTEKYTADDAVYEKLPGCCLYQRKNTGTKKEHSTHKH